MVLGIVNDELELVFDIVVFDKVVYLWFIELKILFKVIGVYEKVYKEFIDCYIDELCVLKVVVIGGGLLGIFVGVLLFFKVLGLEFMIYEKN